MARWDVVEGVWTNGEGQGEGVKEGRGWSIGGSWESGK